MKKVDKSAKATNKSIKKNESDNKGMRKVLGFGKPTTEKAADGRTRKSSVVLKSNPNNKINDSGDGTTKSGGGNVKIVKPKKKEDK